MPRITTTPRRKAEAFSLCPFVDPFVQGRRRFGQALKPPVVHKFQEQGVVLPAHESRVVPVTDNLKYRLDEDDNFLVPKRDFDDVVTFV